MKISLPMRSHLLSLFDRGHRIWTISLLLAAVILITGSQIVGTTDNLPGLTMLFAGVILLFFSVLHPWRNAKNYGILAAICGGLIILGFLAIILLSALHLQRFISEGIAMVTLFLFCLPGIIVGIIGSFLCSLRKE
jgi:hypothetical protein